MTSTISNRSFVRSTRSCKRPLDPREVRQSSRQNVTNTRGRTALVSIILIIALTLLLSPLMSTMLHIEEADASTIRTIPTQTIMVNAGDNLWNLASTYSIDGCSTPEVVSWIRSINNLSDSTLIAGTTLRVPA